MDERSPGYYAIIPSTVRYDTAIPANAKLLYGEISALLTAEGFCFASNQYFADLYSVTIKSISRLISLLEQAGYIQCQIEKDKSGKVLCRKIYLLDIKPIDKNVYTPGQNCGGGMDKIVQYTNTSINNINNKKEKIIKKEKIDHHSVFVAWIQDALADVCPREKKNKLYTRLMEYKDMRSEGNSPLNTTRKINGLLSDLIHESKGDVDVMCEMLRKATNNCWKSVHGPKGAASAPVKKEGGSVMIEI